MKKFILVLVGLLILFGLAWWFWSLGRMPKVSPTKLLLRVERGTVQLKRGPDGAWTTASREQEIATGDVVRTGHDSTASISAFDFGESRLSANTEVTIQAARHEIEDGDSFVVQLYLSSGRLWSRLVRLFDLHSSFSVRSNTVVATVRGTAFDLQAETTSTILLVTDAAVEVSVGAGNAAQQKLQPLIVSQGSTASFDFKGKLLASSPISSAAKQSDWFTQNSTRDETFVHQANERVITRLTELRPVSPDSALDGLTRWSERWHLTLQRDEAPQLFALYTARRLFAIKQLIEGGKSGLGFQALSALEEEMNARFKGAEGASYRRATIDGLKDVLRLLETVDPSSPVYRLKQRVEDVHVKLNSAAISEAAGAAKLAYARLLVIETQVIVAERLLTKVDAEQVKEMLDTARQAISNVERDVDHVSNQTPVDDVAALRVKLFVIKAREAAVRVRLSSLLQASQATTTLAVPPTVTPTSSVLSMPALLPSTTTPKVQTSTVDVIKPSTPPAATRPSSLSLQNLTFIAQPNPAQIGEAVRLMVTGQRSDGSTVDVTALSRFELIGALGSLNGPTYVALKPGSVTLKATVLERGVVLSATVNVQVVTKPVVLSSLEVNASVHAIGFGGRVPLSARAIYSDGSVKDVTPAINFNVSSLETGSVVGNLFQAGQALATARITGAYTEGGINVTGSTEISVGLELR